MGHSMANEVKAYVPSTESPLVNEGGNCDRSSNGGAVLKKGPWTSTEDSILLDYVKKHGEGNWNAVQKHSGLFRCGKSCRLRWANHLRPNLKKGAFTPEEEHLIIELHAKMGNKWARMAAHLPGRTDNEIKNYWNTRIKRRQRAGLPLYPPELCVQAPTENQQNVNAPGTYGGDKGRHSLLQCNSYEETDVMFHAFNINQEVLPHIPEFLDISASGSLTESFGSSQFCSFVPHLIGHQKCTRELDEPVPWYIGGVASESSTFYKVQKDSCESKISLFNGPFFHCDSDHTKKLLPFGVNQGSHLVSNGHFSTSMPSAGAVKLELPSLQCQETSMLPVLDSVDYFLQSPLCAPLQPDYDSPQSSGLLEALLYEAKTLSNSKNRSSEKSMNSSAITSGDITNSSAFITCSTEFGHYHDSSSTLRNSTGLIFSGCMSTNATASSLEEKMPVCNVKSEAVDESWIVDGEKRDFFDQLSFLGPDATLDSCWLEQSVSCSKEQGSATDSVAAFLGSDLTSMPSATSAAYSLGSCTWNNMTPICQMSELP